MLNTVIYAAYLIALIGATILFVLKSQAHWDAQKKIKARLVDSKDAEEQAKHRFAFNHATVEALSWTAITICSIYACFDCLVSLLNTL